MSAPARSATIHIEFTSLWISGTGAGQGRSGDVITHRAFYSPDGRMRIGLPAMPMTQVKGQLRETAEMLAASGSAGWTKELVALLFGGRSETDDPAVRTQGALAFRGDARLPEDIADQIVKSQTSTAPYPVEKLFKRVASTAVNELGAALDRTLRQFEAAVPMTICARIDWRGPGDLAQDWVNLLDQAAAATLAFGKAKNSGFGRAIARVAIARVEA